MGETQMNKRNKILITIVGIVVCLANIFLWIVGKKNNTEFFNITLMGLLSLDVSIIVSVYLVQSLISKRRRYDFLAKMFDLILSDLGKTNLLDHNNHIESSLLQRYISNRLLYISKVVPGYAKIDIDYIVQAFERIQTYYGDHGEASANDVYYEREKVNISIRIAKIQLILFGFNISDK
jgi:hypothetical protein